MLITNHRFTEADHIEVKADGVELEKPKVICHGRFLDMLKVGYRTYWRIEHYTDTLPANYVKDDELYALYLENKDTMFDRWELRYTHNWLCTYDEIKALFTEIAQKFYDPQTALLSSRTLFIPTTLTSVNRYPGRCNPVHPTKVTDIHYYWNPNHESNWEMLVRPFTSDQPFNAK